ncbi:hypothetical protein B0A48_04540 [Cryoendolithus antarcticus]|uniref:UBC core domain-containing protein n=1 Tax=Cryoendolithus antarcticus TaxID=1507870 RepID=A0A1V8TFN7_9PEZI|nr:hypothetical protein B0A48_04540 [Cryoendolithus antarcticus]
MTLKARSLTRQELSIEFHAAVAYTSLESASIKHVCPRGVYVAPLPEDALQWTGVLFVRKGPYADAILKFDIAFPEDYPLCAPVITFEQEVFHPLVTPLTTYSYSSRDRDAETISSGDDGRLPPGGLSLREGFPEWFYTNGQDLRHEDTASGVAPPHTLHVLHYLRLIFTAPELLDELQLAGAANPSAWHAWQAHRKRAVSSRTQSPAVRSSDESRSSDTISERSLSPRGSVQQPGGARRPGEWNWNGVWEDRVRRVVMVSQSESALYGADSASVISFTKRDMSEHDAAFEAQAHRT